MLSDVTPLHEDPTLPRLRFGRADADAAWSGWGCNCGPTAIAAAASCTLEQMRGWLHPMNGRPWPGYVTPSLACELLKAIRVRFGAVRLSEQSGGCRQAGERQQTGERQWPTRGVVRVQWTGPWMAAGVPIGARYQRTHWIACCQVGERTAVFDVNNWEAGLEAWTSFEHWSAITVPRILEVVHRSDGGWFATHGYWVGGRS